MKINGVRCTGDIAGQKILSNGKNFHVRWHRIWNTMVRDVFPEQLWNMKENIFWCIPVFWKKIWRMAHIWYARHRALRSVMAKIMKKWQKTRWSPQTVCRKEAPRLIFVIRRSGKKTDASMHWSEARQRMEAVSWHYLHLKTRSTGITRKWSTSVKTVMEKCGSARISLHLTAVRFWSYLRSLWEQKDWSFIMETIPSILPEIMRKRRWLIPEAMRDRWTMVWIFMHRRR